MPFWIRLGSEEAISALGDGFNVAGVLGVIAKRLPQFADGHPQAAVEVDKGIVPPDAVAKFLTADHVSGLFQEHYEEPEWLLLQLYPVPVFQEFAGGGIHLERSEAKERTERRLHHRPQCASVRAECSSSGGSLRPISSCLIRDDLVVHRRDLRQVSLTLVERCVVMRVPGRKQKPCTDGTAEGEFQ
jgi:hypothetical protein